jgi:hypothetical protein
MEEEKLIILVQGHECLYNLQHKDYDNSLVKDLVFFFSMTVCNNCFKFSNFETNNKLRGLSLRANYTDRAAAAGRRS